MQLSQNLRLWRGATGIVGRGRATDLTYAPGVQVELQPTHLREVEKS